MYLLQLFPKKNNFIWFSGYVKQIYGNSGTGTAMQLFSEEEKRIILNIIRARRAIVYDILDFSVALSSYLGDISTEKINGLMAKILHRNNTSMFGGKYLLFLKDSNQKKMLEIMINEREYLGIFLLKIASAYRKAAISTHIYGLHIFNEDFDVYSENVPLENMANFRAIIESSTCLRVETHNNELQRAIEHAFTLDEWNWDECDNAFILLFQKMQSGTFLHVIEDINVLERRIKTSHPVMIFYQNLLVCLKDKYWAQRLQ